MLRYYFIKLKNNKFSDELIYFFKSILLDDGLEIVEETLALVKSEKDLNIIFESVLKNLEIDFSININIMFSHNYFSYYKTLLDESFNYFKNCVFSIYEILLYLNLANIRKYNPFLIDEFKNVKSSLIDTCEMYIKCNKNALETAQKIRIHRNTLNLRMNQFIEKTNLDIRDFYNASYFFLYLKIREMYICA